MMWFVLLLYCTVHENVRCSRGPTRCTATIQKVHVEWCVPRALCSSSTVIEKVHRLHRDMFVFIVSPTQQLHRHGICFGPTTTGSVDSTTVRVTSSIRKPPSYSLRGYQVPHASRPTGPVFCEGRHYVLIIYYKYDNIILIASYLIPGSYFQPSASCVALFLVSSNPVASAPKRAPSGTPRQSS